MPDRKTIIEALGDALYDKLCYLKNNTRFASSEEYTKISTAVYIYDRILEDKNKFTPDSTANATDDVKIGAEITLPEFTKFMEEYRENTRRKVD
ncbi:MAG: hypothetical protein ACI4EA_10205 [Candidatus Ornithomonoglobus sp.]